LTTFGDLRDQERTAMKKSKFTEAQVAAARIVKASSYEYAVATAVQLNGDVSRRRRHRLQSQQL
jgi:hypothetical protein